eukprot:g23102.t1
MKTCAAELAASLAKLFQYSYNTGIYPGTWKIAQVCPVHKKLGNSNQANYLPISLLSIISQVMEGVLNSAIKQHMHSKTLLSDAQFGFSQIHSAPDLITALVQILATEVSSMFKTGINGYRGQTLQWLQSYLTHRKMDMVVGGQASQLQDISAGVRQGSILSPTVFSCFINDLPSII